MKRSSCHSKTDMLFAICQGVRGQLYDFAIYLVDIAIYFTSDEIG